MKFSEHPSVQSSEAAIWEYMEWQTQRFRSPTDVECRLLNPPCEICLDVLTIMVEIGVNNESVIRQSLILAWCPTLKPVDILAYNF